MKSIDEKPVVDSVVHKCGSSQKGQFKDADGMPSRAVAALRLLVRKKAKKARRRLKGAKAPPFFQEPF